MPDIPAPAATAARALLASLVRHALVAAGAALVTRGIVTQGQANGIIPTLVESVVGALLVAGATARRRCAPGSSTVASPPRGRR